jgi:accessory secretory protein Asp2
LDYDKEEGCSIELDVQFIESGSPDIILTHDRYSEEELSSPIVFSHESDGYLVCSVFAKGKGIVRVGPIHFRHSRLGAGQFIAGGKRICDGNRQELFYYFHPGNLKPPLNIYFAGYKQEEGFGGYMMMKRFGHPFLLIYDPRLEGGKFFLGGSDLEETLVQTIRDHMDLLAFNEEDLIFSGISMGSFAALHYGFKFKAYAIIVCKPILNAVYMADRTRLVRPDEFLTILDIVRYWDKTDENGNLVPLKKFHEELEAQWSGGDGFGNTKVLIAYMEQDDYDDQAYYYILKTQSCKNTEIIGKGYQGRHNDQNAEIAAWFSSQFNRTIKEFSESKNEQS